VVCKFLECGDLKHGFARVRCPRGREEFFVAYSCRVCSFCPSCHEKRALEKAGWVAEQVCAEVPHRQFVFTIPKRLRIYFRFERRLLGELCRAAARTVTTVYRAASGRPDAVPGMIGAIQTFGQLVHWHPHIHALVTEGVFLPDGSFLPLLKLATEPFLKLWEQEVFALLLRESTITEEVIANIRSWKHSGFSVDQSVRLEVGDREGVQRLIRYYGWYSNKTRGQRAKRQPAAGTATARAPTAREARKGWAALIKQVYEADPLCCPKCGLPMRIISLIERHQTEVIERILLHCGLWEASPARGPPVPEVSVEG